MEDSYPSSSNWLEDAGDVCGVQALPECKIKRNYLCMLCAYFTQNPRFYLHHLRDVHQEKMRIYECPHCLYASKHSQKLNRHVAMVHAPGKPARRRSNGSPGSSRATRLPSDARTAPSHKGRPPTVPSVKILVQKPGHTRALSQQSRRSAGSEPATSGKMIEASNSEPDDDDFLDDDSSDRLVIEYPEEEEDEQQPDEGAEVAADEEEEEEEEEYEAGGREGEGEAAGEAAGKAAERRETAADEDVQEYGQAQDSRLEMDPVTRQYKCSSCGFQSKTPSLVARHESVVHLKKKFYRCSKCTYVTHLKARYTKHYKYHTMPLIKCGECDFRTPYKWNLDRHLKNHNGSGSFQCTACSFSADIKQSLTVHEMNHHSPPVAGAPDRVVSRRRYKVGSSDCRNITEEDTIEQHELELLRLEREDSAAEVDLETDVLDALEADQSFGGGPGVLLGKRSSNSMELASGARIGSKTADKPGRNKSMRCSQCDYRSAHIADMSRHVFNQHGSIKSSTASPTRPSPSPTGAPPAKRIAKPLPNLIPILPQSVPATPLIRSSQSVLKTSFSEKSIMSDHYETSTRLETSSTTTNDSIEIDDLGMGDDIGRIEEEQEKTHNARDKKKNSFFDQLKLFPGNNTDSSLICISCGHEAKCLSELVRHNKLHSGQSRGVTVSSTRCQHCRHRCKTHADLLAHLKTCAKATEAFRALDTLGENEDCADSEIEDRRNGYTISNSKRSSSERVAHPMENKVFVWNNMPDEDKSADLESLREGEFAEGEEEEEPPDEEEVDDDASGSNLSVPTADPTLLGVETAPGYGAVTTQNDFEANAAQDKILQTVTSLKKVFKCPHCSFWASTASRFHVHIVGHLNKKPFECSLCNYRSNWRWDITKHIRLKASRDPSHEEAKVLMTDETGRRNYSKYNKYLMLLKVAEPNAENLITNNGRQSKAAASGTQGNVTGPVEPVPILPAPPKLTRAPTPRPPAPASTGALLRPPPPLQAGTTHLIILPAGVRLQQPPQLVPQQGSPPPSLTEQPQANKRPADEPLPKLGSDPKKSNSEIKKTVWRCKQCHFRDGDRAVVLAHVKGHYRQQQEAALAKLSGGSIRSIKSEKQGENYKPFQFTPLRCLMCPYITLKETSLQTHLTFHKQRPDAVFKCYYCPYYVNKKDDLLQHMNVHKVTYKKEDGSPVEEAESTNCNFENYESPVSPQKSSDQESVSDSPPKKEIVTSTESQVDHKGAKASSLPIPTILDLVDYSDAPICWVLRNEKLVKMYRCRFCPHVNLRKTNIGEHEKMHGKRPSAPPGESGEIILSSQFVPYPCSECSYVCNNAGVLSSHMKVHLSGYPQAYGVVDSAQSEQEQTSDLIEKFNLSVKISPDEAEKVNTASIPEELPDIGNENKLSGINLMNFLNPNQSLTDAVLAMKKKFNLELDGEPFAEPLEDFTESPPNSPLKQLNEGLDPVIGGVPDEKKLHFCRLCPARFLFRKELGIHARFHNLHLVHRCDNCSYTARQRTHLQAHFKVHTDDYQERTGALVKMYDVHKDFPMPRTAAIPQKPGVQGTVWVVVNAVTKPEIRGASPISIDKAKYLCSKCPATFFKALALEYHNTLHGGDGTHKCRVCDYAVKTYGNLVKHMMIHGVKVFPKKARGDTKKEQLCTSNFKDATSGDEQDDAGNEQDEDMNHGNKSLVSSPEKDDVKENDPNNSPLKLHDEEPGLMITGCPDFVYPTYFRNGRRKEKRYKCLKCPSAFEKRDQYNIHLSLHGSNQRYVCQKCDYSVKYYANYIQHLRRHKISEDARAASLELPVMSEADEFTVEYSENAPSLLPSPVRSGKTTGGKGEKLSVADQQTLMIMQQRRAKRTLVSRETLDKNYWCTRCPYSSPRRDQVESHMKRHISESGVRNAYVCEHCDYSVPNKHFLRDHYKIHFDVSKAPRPDAFMICDRLELWASSDSLHKGQSSSKMLVFQDKACNGKADRFVPSLRDEGDNNEDMTQNRIFINLKTFEPDTRSGNGVKEITEIQGENDSGNEEVKGNGGSEDVALCSEDRVITGSSNVSTVISATLKHEVCGSTNVSSKDTSDVEGE